MDINWIKIESFKRFNEQSTLDLTGKLVALLGPNEAGKSTVLEAISYLSNDSQIPDLSLPRGSEGLQVKIEGKFTLDQEDLKEANLSEPTYMLVKRDSTKRNYELFPTPPKREIRRRKTLKGKVDRLLGNDKVSKNIEDNHPQLITSLSGLSNILSSESEDLTPKHLQQLQICSQQLDQHLTLTKPKYAIELSSEISEQRERDLAPNPTRFAINALIPRIPAFLEFTIDQRDLKPEYNLTEVVKNIPIPLKNLASISDLDLNKLNRATERGDRAQAMTLLGSASNKLRAAFNKTWSQSGIRVHFDLEGKQLKIFIVDEGERLSSLGERSDGLKQFVALQAFTTVQRSEKPILLIDEAELHLHYDGQADLVQMLTKQDVATKIIYSTHSAGCLPEDLGVGTRLVVPNNESLTSEIKNKFWGTKEQGFVPLLFGMGATTLAFFPVRNALVAEGQTEMLLLPTLFRQASISSVLGFQVVPGLSETSLSILPAMETSGKGVAYFVDADKAGDDLRDDLKKLGIDEDDIHNVKRPVGSIYTTEDLIKIEHYVIAVNKVLSEFYPQINKVTKNDLRSNNGNRVEKLSDFCKKNGIKDLSKIEVAYQLLDMVSENQNLNLLDSKFKAEMKKIYEKINARFKNIPNSSQI